MNTFSRRRFLGTAVQTLGVASVGALVRPASANRAPQIAATELAPGLTLLDGAGCNVVAVHGPDGSLLIDGGYAQNSKALQDAAAKATTNRRVNTLINTHWHPAQTGSNERIGRDGGLIIAHERTRLYLGRAVSSVDYEGLYGPLPEKARPTRTTRDKGALEFGGLHVEYGYLPAAHTDGDLYIHFPERNLIVAGGPVASQSWPLLDFRNGGWLGGLVKAHERLAALAKPDTRVVPANGRLLTGSDIARHSKMYHQLHEELIADMSKGFGASEVVASRPLKDHEAEFGDATAFLRGAYQSLILAYTPD